MSPIYFEFLTFETPLTEAFLFLDNFQKYMIKLPRLCSDYSAKHQDINGFIKDNNKK
jgi:hypothetical protein